MSNRRKNSLYPTLSAELSALMRTGWADTERHDLAPAEQAPYAALRRAALSARFPGERLVVPSGNLKVRSNDDTYPFRSYSGYVHMTGDQARDGALVLEPRPDGGHDAYCYQLPRDSRDDDEFWTGAHAELWTGRRRSLAESERVLGLPCRDVRTAAADLAAVSEVRTRIVRGIDPALEAAVTTDEERDAELEDALSDLRLVKDAWELGELRKAVDSTVRGFTDVVGELSRAVASSERWLEGHPSSAGHAWRATRWATARSAPPASTPRSCTGRTTTARSARETCCSWTPVWRRAPSTPPTSPAPCRSAAPSRRSSARCTTRCTRPRRPGSPRSSRAPRTATSTRPPSATWRHGWWSGASSRAPPSGRTNWVCSAASPWPAPVTCWAWTSTTARGPARRSTSRACWSRACA
ncbi:xaa-Pro aminopeptidase II [Streptomyces lividans TK24]|nr:xaa-Pro aminopeptidase II [Streptomyces lividans TK24]